jgi:hypothetical protein
MRVKSKVVGRSVQTVEWSLSVNERLMVHLSEAADARL